MNKTFEKKYLELSTVHRRSLHRIPEIDRALFKTNAYISEELAKLDCEVTAVCETGLCAFFDMGQENTIGFRADMDALPVHEKNKIDFASVHEGKMHACGHDGHMSMVLTLGQYIDELKKTDASEIKYNVLLVFQPSEEAQGGAKEICETGIFAKYNTKAIFGIHMWPFIEKGALASRSGTLMPKSSEINIRIKGKSAHATAPEEGLNALLAGARFVDKLYKAHEKSQKGVTVPEDRTIACIGKFDSGTARNVIAGTCNLKGTIRAFTNEHFNSLLKLLEETAEKQAKASHCRFKVTHSEGYDPVYNDPKLFASLAPVLSGFNYINFEKPLMISEDFSFYRMAAPSTMFLLGTGTGIALHSDNFDFEEDVLMTGLKLYISILKADIL